MKPFIILTILLTSTICFAEYYPPNANVCNFEGVWSTDCIPRKEVKVKEVKKETIDDLIREAAYRGMLQAYKEQEKVEIKVTTTFEEGE